MLVTEINSVTGEITQRNYTQDEIADIAASRGITTEQVQQILSDALKEAGN